MKMKAKTAKKPSKNASALINKLVKQDMQSLRRAICRPPPCLGGCR